MEKEFLGDEISLFVETRKIELQSLVHKSFEKQLPLALWRKPLSSRLYLALSLKTDTAVDNVELENLGTGFLFCPFEKNEEHGNHFIKDDILICFDDKKEPVVQVKNSFNYDLLRHLFSEDYSSPSKAKFCTSIYNPASVCATADDFKSMVQKSIDAIASGTMTKVVPARCKVIDLDPGFDVLAFFEELESSYPNAFVYLVSIPGIGTWVGATPENLISVDDSQIFKTTAMAGTQSYQEGMVLTEAAWRQKEIEEQALVSRYIINCLKKIRLREFEEIGPKTIKAGNLIHLKTDFIVNMNEVNYPFLPTVMLNLLHPTSAICGMPKEPALEFIHQHENFDRSYFSGYLGPVHIENNTNLFVNIRCMQFLSENKVAIYAGAGVTVDSVPHKEWEETELKMKTLLEKMKNS